MLTRYDRTLSDSAEITAGLTPPNWLGPASESYQEAAREPLEAHLRTAQEINAAVIEEVERHQDFRAQLATLWQDPHERTHMRTVHRSASDRLAELFLAKAAELDEVQRTPADPVVRPEPRTILDSRPVETTPGPEPGTDPPAFPESRDPGGQEEHGAPDDGADHDAADENGQTGSGGDDGHNGHGVLPPGTAAAHGAGFRDETERASWLRALPPPSLVRTDIVWDGDDWS